MSDAITAEILQSISKELGNEFDSHDIIFSLMRKHPREYATDLFGFVSSPDPILSLHASIGQRLLSLNTLIPIRKVKSLNARGEESENQLWELTK